MNAYELADWIQNSSSFGHFNTAKQAVNMLRQQADRIAELEKELLVWQNAEVPVEVMAELIAELQRKGLVEKAQTKPLSNDEILEMTIWNKNLYELYVEMEKEDMIAFARAIEERHGIK